MSRPKLAINDGPCINGCERRAHCRGMCRSCYRRDRYEQVERERRGCKPMRRIAVGETFVNKAGYVMVKTAEPRQYELLNRVVMAEAIGRPLSDEETVHHKNGNKLDNKLKNLELWASRHPKGQRVEDLLEFAYDIIERYDGLLR